MSPKKRKKRSFWPWLLLLIGLPALSIGMWLWASGSRSEGKKKPTKTSVQGSKKMTNEDRVLATGVIRPQVGAEVNVGTRISGRVEKVYAAIGNQAKKGDVLAELEKEELEAAVKKAEAAAAAAWTKLVLLKKGARSEEIESARASVQAARAVMEDAEREMKRREKLFAEELISQEQLDHARRDYEVGKSKVKGAEEALSLKKKLYRPEEIALARYNAVEAKAALESARIRLDYAVIRSPINGVVATVAMQNGETVSVGLQAPTLVTIIDLERLQVEAYVDEVDIGRVKVGSPATFTVDTYPDKTFKGKVQAIYPKAVLEDNVVNYLTIISFTNAPGTLRPGMTTNVTIQIQDKEVARREGAGGGAMAVSKREVAGGEAKAVSKREGAGGEAKAASKR